MTELEAFLTEAETHIAEFLKTAEGTHYETEWFAKMTMAEKIETRQLMIRTLPPGTIYEQTSNRLDCGLAGDTPAIFEAAFEEKMFRRCFFPMSVPSFKTA